MPPLVEIFRVLAPITSVVMFFSPVPTIRTIIRTKSTGHMPFLPLISMVCNAHIWMVYGWLAGKYIEIFATFGFGMVVSTIYVAVYFKYTTERAYATKLIAIFASVITINSVYAILGANGYTNQSYNGVRLTIGYIAVVSSVVMYTSPFEKIPLVLKHKSGVFIPIHIVSVGCVSSAAWVMFSLLEIDWQAFAPNMILLLVGLLQVAFYWAYNPATHPLQVDLSMLSPSMKEVDSGSSDDTSLTHSPTHADAIGSNGKVDFVPLRSPV